jgi:hypothetical protein
MPQIATVPGGPGLHYLVRLRQVKIAARTATSIGNDEGSGTACDGMVMLPLRSVSIGTLPPDSSERLVIGNNPKATGKEPLGAIGETSNNTWPRPAVVPAPTVTPEKGMANRSDVESDWPLVGPVKSGPNSESAPKMYGAAVEVFASVKLMFKFAIDIPKLKPPIVTAEGPELRNSTSIPLAEDPAVAITDCTETIKSARAVAGPRKQATSAAARLMLNFTISSNLCLFTAVTSRFSS